MTARIEASGTREDLARRYAFGLDIVSVREFEAASCRFSSGRKASMTIESVAPGAIDEGWVREGETGVEYDRGSGSGDPASEASVEFHAWVKYEGAS